MSLGIRARAFLWAFAMSNESRLSLTIDSRGAKTDAEDLKRALEELEKAGVRVTASTTDAGSAATGAGRSFSQAGREAKSGAGGVNDLNKSLEKTNQDAANATAGLVRMAKQIGLGFAVVKTIDMADEWGQYASRIKQATKSTEEYDYVQRRMVASANDTFRSINETREGFIQLSPILRSVGLSLEQSIDLVDSFSSLLVINAASADKGSNSMNALTKAMQKGKVEGDGWMSIMAAMPNLADKIAAATGKTVEEIRRLGVEGKITADMLSKGLLGSYQENLQQVKEMPTTVRDAMRNVQNSFQDYIGWANEANGVTGSMATALVTLGNNFDTFAAIVGGVGAGALTLYASRAAFATAASVSQMLAQRALAAEELRLAQSHATAATAALAQANALNGLGTSVASVTAATNTLQAANARLATAQAGYTTITRGLLGILGGPVGLALTVGAAAASWLIYSSNSDKANEKIKEMQGSVDGLVESFKKLNENQRAGAIVESTKAHEKAVGDLDDAYKKLEANILSAYANTGVNRSQLSGVRDQLLAAKDAGESFIPIIERVSRAAYMREGVADTWKIFAKEVGDAQQTATNTKAALDALTGTQNQLANSAGAAATQQNILNDAIAKTDDEGRKYLENLRKQSVLAGKTTELSRLQALAQEGLMVLSKEDMSIAEQRAKRIDAANRGLKEGNKLENERKAALKSLTKSLTEQVEVLGMTEAQQIRWRFAQQKATPETLKAVDALLAKKTAHLQAAAASEIDTASMIRARKAQEDLLLFQKKNNLEITGMGLGNSKREQLQREFDVEQDFHGKRVELSHQMIQLQQDQAVASKRIDDEVYEARKRDLETQVEETYLAQEQMTQAVRSAAEQRTIAEQSWLTGASEAWANYSDNATNTARLVEGVFTNAFSSIESTLFDFVKTGQLDLGNLFSSIADDVIKMLIKMGVQMAVNALLGKTMGAAATAASVAMAGTSAAAWAPAAAFASLASFGANAAPATAGIISTVGIAEGLALAGMAHSGIDNIPKEGTWLLDKGERVLNPRQNADFTQFLKKESANDSGRSGNSNGNVIVNLYESRERAGQVEQSAGVDDQRIINVFVADIGNGGKASQAIERAYGLNRRGR